MIAISTIELTVRMVAALVVILALLAGCNFVLRRYFGVSASQKAAIRVRYQQRLDKHASVHLVEAGGRRVLVGTTTGSIVVLAEGDDLVSEPVGDQSLDKQAVCEQSSDKQALDKGSVRIDLRNARPVRLLQNKTVRRQ